MAFCIKHGKFPNEGITPNKPTKPEFNYNINLCTNCLDLIKKLTGMDFEELTIGGPLWPIPCQLCGTETRELHFMRKLSIVSGMKKAVQIAEDCASCIRCADCP